MKHARLLVKILFKDSIKDNAAAALPLLKLKTQSTLLLESKFPFVKYAIMDKSKPATNSDALVALPTNTTLPKQNAFHVARTNNKILLTILHKLVFATKLITEVHLLPTHYFARPA